MKKLKKQLFALIILVLTNIMLYIYPYEETHDLSIQLFGDKTFITIIGELFYIVMSGIIPIFFVFFFITLYEYLYGKINLLKVYITTIATSLVAVMLLYIVSQTYMAAAFLITAAVFIFILLDYSLRSIMIKLKNNKK